MTDLAAALADAGGAAAPPTATAALKRALALALDRGRAELEKPRSGYGGTPVTVGVALAGESLLAVLPVDAGFAADPEAAPVRASLLAAAVCGALLELGAPPVLTGALEGNLVVAVRGEPLPPRELEELLPVAAESHLTGIDRLRARALALPAALLADALGGLREPIGATHPLRIAQATAQLGGRPADARWVDEHEEEILGLLGAAPGAGGAMPRPHEDADPARRVARRILQRLAGMGKWGGYHTDFAHLSRGFAGNDRQLAQEVGEALLAAGLLAEKPSVGQRHVYLDPRRAADIHALVERGQAPDGLALPRDTVS